MKPASILLLLAWVAAIPEISCIQSAGAATASARYVRVSDWVQTSGLELRWVKRDETFELSNRNAKLLFKVDSTEAEINGVGVRLLFPVVDHGGEASMAQLDLQKTLQPLLTLPRNRAHAQIKTICLDPGHGGRDPGFQIGSHQEKQYTLLLAQELRKELVRAGFVVALTRSRDSFVELSSRPEVARRRKADLFVSLHFNSTESSRNSVQGIEVYCMTPAGAASTNARGEGAGAGAFEGNRNDDKNMFLAYQLQKVLTRDLPVEDRGVHRARFEVLRDAAMPAVLIEAGFMSHPIEGRRIFDAGYRAQMARAIAQGLLAYKRTVE
jgi:N-acetylmuramoyl-L-alanine amidase